MRFEPIDTFDADARGGALVARPRRWPMLIGAVAMAAAAAAVAYGFDDFVFRYCSSPFLLFFAFLLFTTSRRAGQRNAWLLAADAQGLSVMLRSPLRTPADPREAAVATFAWREIAWVRSAVVTEAGGLNGQRAERNTYLDVALRDVDAAALAERIEAAQATSDSWKFGHTVARLLDGPILRLEYSGPTLRMRPAIRETLRVLAGFTIVRDAERS